VNNARRVARSQTRTSSVRVPESVQPLLRRLGDLAQSRGVDAYAVGGCVRDWMVGVTGLVDLDVVVVGDGLAFAREAARSLHATLTTHEQFGTAMLALPASVRAAPVRLDVATARKERYAAPAAYPKVTPGTLRDDLLRRDFTINAMALAITPEAFGRVIDPFGGARDLRAKRLRVLHEESFLDDPSRILRAVRFVERFGLTLEPSTARALRRAINENLLARLNRGRLRKELERITQEPDPIACLARVGRWLTT